MAAANVRQPLPRWRIQIMTLTSHATIWGIKGLAEPGLAPKGLTDPVWLVAERENRREPRNLPPAGTAVCAALSRCGLLTGSPSSRFGKVVDKT